MAIAYSAATSEAREYRAKDISRLTRQAPWVGDFDGTTLWLLTAPGTSAEAYSSQTRPETTGKDISL